MENLGRFYSVVRGGEIDPKQTSFITFIHYSATIGSIKVETYLYLKVDRFGH